MDKRMSAVGGPLGTPARRPDAVCHLMGRAENAGLEGWARLWQTAGGVLLWAAVRGLPVTGRLCDPAVFALHIHAGERCAGTPDQPFADVDGHYNPGKCPHPAHAGDLPPLFADRQGRAWYAVRLDRFTVREVLGHTMIVHAHADDFTSQPSGNAGEMIACGVIHRPQGRGGDRYGSA